MTEPQQATQSAVSALLQTQSTMTLATCGEAGPWAAAVFFASDERLNLYFVSDPRTRHGRDLAECGRAAAAIQPDCDNWGEIRGVQLEGAVSSLDGDAGAAALDCYLEKFARIRALCEQPCNDDERMIADRLRSATLYRLSPERIRLIDNTRGFGFKAELLCAAPRA